MNGTCAAKVSMSSKVVADCMHFLTSWLNCPDFSVFSNNFFAFVSTSLKMVKTKQKYHKHMSYRNAYLITYVSSGSALLR